VESPYTNEGLAFLSVSSFTNSSNPHTPTPFLEISKPQNKHVPVSMSTSSNTTIGLFPPSSSVTGCQEKCIIKECDRTSSQNEIQKGIPNHTPNNL
jgi:hypothetical protein